MGFSLENTSNKKGSQQEDAAKIAVEAMITTVKICALRNWPKPFFLMFASEIWDEINEK